MGVTEVLQGGYGIGLALQGGLIEGHLDHGDGGTLQEGVASARYAALGVHRPLGGDEQEEVFAVAGGVLVAVGDLALIGAGHKGAAQEAESQQGTEQADDGWMFHGDLLRFNVVGIIQWKGQVGLNF